MQSGVPCGIPPSGLKCNGCLQFLSYTQAVVFSTKKYAKLDMNSNCISILVENLNWETSSTPQYFGFISWAHHAGIISLKSIRENLVQ